MDVKFPLDNYLRYQEANSDADKSRHMSDFLRDVRGRVKEVVGREYINPEQNTVDYVLLFIPNEQVYAFIHEQDRTILDDALMNKVVFCSPLTLYAILAVIRRAVDNFTLEKDIASNFSRCMVSFRSNGPSLSRKWIRWGRRSGMHRKFTRRSPPLAVANWIVSLTKSETCAHRPVCPKTISIQSRTIRNSEARGIAPIHPTRECIERGSRKGYPYNTFELVGPTSGSTLPVAGCSAPPGL